MSIEIIDITAKEQLRDFIDLPYHVHRHHQRWVPPLIRDEWRYFDSHKNRSFADNDTILCVAYEDLLPVGRIMGIMNHKHNQRMNERNARFGYLECYKNQDVADALLARVEQWAHDFGMTKLVGPMGFSDQDPEGFIVEGYEHEPTIATYYNYDYIPRFLDVRGYSKEVDYVVYLLDLTKPLPEVFERIHRRFHERAEYEFLEFSTKKQLKPYVRPILRLMSETFSHLYGFDPLTDGEIDELAAKYLPAIDPRFVKAARTRDVLVGFLIAMPNLNDGFRKARGRLFPFGIVHFFRAFRTTRQLDLLVGGVKEEFRGRGLDMWGLLAVIHSAQQAGFTLIDSHHELENNTAVRNGMERLGGKLCKRFRIYQKAL